MANLRSQTKLIYGVFRETESYFNNFWVVVFKNGYGILLGHGTLKSATSRLIEYFLHADSDRIIFGLIFDI